MAEALLRQATKGDFFHVASAGAAPAGYVHPFAVEVMKEIGLDLSEARSKNLSEFLEQGQVIHTVITVCGNVDQDCPVFPGQLNRYHWPFDDPPNFKGSEEEIKTEFRRVRDEIKLVCEAYICGIRENSHTRPSATTGISKSQ